MISDPIKITSILFIYIKLKMLSMKSEHMILFISFWNFNICTLFRIFVFTKDWYLSSLFLNINVLYRKKNTTQNRDERMVLCIRHIHEQCLSICLYLWGRSKFASIQFNTQRHEKENHVKSRNIYIDIWILLVIVKIESFSICLQFSFGSCVFSPLILG